MKKKIKTVIEGIFITAMMVFASAMDSPSLLIPVIGVFVSTLGLLITSRVKA